MEIMKEGFKDSGIRQGFGTGAVRDGKGSKGAFHLVPPICIYLLGRVYEDGAKKYSSRNWEKGIPLSVFIDSAERHLAKYKMGLRDEPHLSMAMWNITGALWTAVMVHLRLRDPALNDLPNHIGSISWRGQDKEPSEELGWDAPPISPSEIASLASFGLTKEEVSKQEDNG